MRLFLGSLSFLSLLYGGLELKAPSTFYIGEAYDFNVIAKGFQIKAARLKQIENRAVTLLKVHNEATLIDGKKAQKRVFYYRISPQKSFTLPAIHATIDGVPQHTKRIKVTRKIPQKTRSPHYDLKQSISNETPFISQKLILELRFSYDPLFVESTTFIAPKIADAKITLLSQTDQKRANGSMLEIRRYRLEFNQSGKITIYPQHILIASQNKSKKRFKFRAHTKPTPVYSNALELRVQKLPNQLDIIGNYVLKASIDQHKLKAGAPVHFTLYLQGNGNLKTLDQIHFSIPHATIYAQKSLITKNQISKNFEIISDRSYQIPSLTLPYFDPVIQEMRLTQTEAFAITVSDAAKEQAPSLHPTHQKTDVAKKDLTSPQRSLSMHEKIFYFSFGVFAMLLIVGIILFTLKWRRQNSRPNSLKDLYRIHKQDLLLKKLLIYLGRDPHLDQLIIKLENAMDDKAFKRLKQTILEKIQELK